MAVETSRAVFVDKDGTIIRDLPYSIDIDATRLMPGAIEGLRAFCEEGFRIVIVTNQSGVARGLYDERRLRTYLRQFAGMLWDLGIRISGISYCPHLTGAEDPRYDRDCDCRKPKPGMLFKAAGLLQIELTSSWMIGDLLDDVETGIRAGCDTALVGTTPNQRMPSAIKPTIDVPTILDVAEFALVPQIIAGS
ncbi:MAG: D-glycero-alpha-D-manno-heptose-1,7-bisphosphate 7-phosphatase [Coriobacteriia bacterium]